MNTGEYELIETVYEKEFRTVSGAERASEVIQDKLSSIECYPGVNEKIVGPIITTRIGINGKPNRTTVKVDVVRGFTDDSLNRIIRSD